jgi:purine-binding chemotaxis protein CheW
MDILAARKKAAEKAKSRETAEPAEPAEPAMPSPAPAEEAARTATAAAPPAATAVASSVNEEAEKSGQTGAGEVAEAPAQEIEMLSFRLSGEEYAVMVDDVREVLKLRDLTAVPNAPAHVLGVISLRGRMLPVMDLCKRLGLTPGVRDDKSRIVVVSPDEEDAGLVVDRVTGILRILPDAIKPSPEHVEQGAEFLRGIVRKNDKLYILLDLQKAVGA